MFPIVRQKMLEVLFETPERSFYDSEVFADLQGPALKTSVWTMCCPLKSQQHTSEK